MGPLDLTATPTIPMVLSKHLNVVILAVVLDGS